jgi:hypothetical protein
MKVAERATPVAAVIAAISTMACCLPLGFVGAVGLAGIGLRVQAARPWLLGAALAMLTLGFFQLYRSRNQCRKRNPISTAIFWTCVTIVLLVLFFPQIIASLLAG